MPKMKNWKKNLLMIIAIILLFVFSGIQILNYGLHGRAHFSESESKALYNNLTDKEKEGIQKGGKK